MLLALCAAKGSPGATTLAVALARRAGELGRPALVVEADPAGADLAARLGQSPDPGLATLAATLRRGASLDLAEHLQHLPGTGAPAALLAGPGLALAGSLEAVHEPLAAALAATDLAIVDLGRAVPESPAWRAYWPAASLRLCCLRPEVAAVAHARVLLAMVEAAELAVIGSEPWPPSEVAEVLEAPLALALPEDATGAGAALDGHRNLPRSWRRGLDPLLERCTTPAPAPETAEVSR